jgi:hypothetical protein
MPSSAKYGRRHQQKRRLLAGKVAAGGAVCARCHKPIRPGEAWDLDHRDDGPGYLGPSHARCNRATVTHLKERLGEAPRARTTGSVATPEPAHDCRAEFNPRRCAACRESDLGPSNEITCWSRHWSGDEFNPRCRDCRERGSACDVALARRAA